MDVAFVASTTRHHTDSDRTARVEGVAAKLAARGHDVTMLTTKWWSSPDQTHTVDGIEYRALQNTPGPGFTITVPWALRDLQPDITHVVHDQPSVVLAADLGGAPVVVDWYDLPADEHTDGLATLQTWARRRSARAPAAVVTPSRLVETSVRELGRHHTDITVIPTGIEFDTIRSISPVDRGEIVYARRLDAAANLGDLLLALAEFRDRAWDALIIGDGPERSTYEAQARDLRIDDRVQFTGPVPVEERLAAFKGAHAYVHTAHRSSFPTDLLRALACGCVGIVSYHEQSSAHEFVEGSPRGFLTTSPEEIAGALTEAATLPQEMIDESYAEYSDETVLNQYLTLYRSLLSNPRLR